MGSIAACFDAVKPVIIGAQKAAEGAKPYVELGEEFLQNPTGIPAIVWVPRGGPVGGARTGTADGNIKNKEIAQRHEAISVYCYEKNFRATEALMQHLVAVMRLHLTANPFSVRSTAWGIGWPVKTNEPLIDVESGTLCVLDIELRVPFVTEHLGTATVTTTTINPQINHA